jgi:hypothetical protein
MKTPLIDLCFYAEKDLEQWLQFNPFVRHTGALILDANGCHALFRSKGELVAEGSLYRGPLEFGYLVKASPEMAARVQKLEQKLRERSGRNQASRAMRARHSHSL